MRLSYHSIRHKYQTYVGISILYVNPPRTETLSDSPSRPVHAQRAHFMPHLGQAHNAAYAESVQVVPTVDFLATTLGISSWDYVILATFPLSLFRLVNNSTGHR